MHFRENVFFSFTNGKWTSNYTNGQCWLVIFVKKSSKTWAKLFSKSSLYHFCLLTPLLITPISFNPFAESVLQPWRPFTTFERHNHRFWLSLLFDCHTLFLIVIHSPVHSDIWNCSFSLDLMKLSEFRLAVHLQKQAYSFLECHSIWFMSHIRLLGLMLPSEVSKKVIIDHGLLSNLLIYLRSEWARLQRNQ